MYRLTRSISTSEFLSLHADDNGWLWVRSAKFSETNRRGMEPFRQVYLDDYEPSEVEDLLSVVDLIAAEIAAGSTAPKLLNRCQSAIRTTRKAVGGRSRRVAPYTVHHQARANLVAMGATPEEVAAIMGHASAGTAQSHYAPARSAWRGVSRLSPPTVDPKLVAKVRPSTRAWSNENRFSARSGPKV